MMTPWPIVSESLGASCGSRWNAFLCLLLALLLLYNPFVFLLHAGGPASVNHHARNRATVGACELQHYSPVSKLTSQRVSIAENSWVVPADTAKAEYCPALAVVLPRICSTDFSSSLWFRPPPTA
jgi:hypothetical protein